jgi:hypothetical protein
MLRMLFFAAIAILSPILLLDRFIELARTPFEQVERAMDAYIASLCDDPEGRTR